LCVDEKESMKTKNGKSVKLDADFYNKTEYNHNYKEIEDMPKNIDVTYRIATNLSEVDVTFRCLCGEHINIFTPYDNSKCWNCGRQYFAKVNVEYDLESSPDDKVQMLESEE